MLFNVLLKRCHGLSELVIAVAKKLRILEDLQTCQYIEGLNIRNHNLAQNVSFLGFLSFGFETEL